MKQLNSQKMTAYYYSINMTVYKALKKKKGCRLSEKQSQEVKPLWIYLAQYFQVCQLHKL
jgi:hypothetical protein